MENRNLVFSTLRKYEISNDQKSLSIYVFTIFALCISVCIGILTFNFNAYLSLIFSITSGILLCRLFVIQHDCGHRSFFTDPGANAVAGIVLGFLTMIPSALWNHIHSVHHGLVGNLAKRKINPELWTMTVREYQAASGLKRIAYRIMRSIVMRLFITPLIWILAPRIPLFHLGRKIFSAIVVHNILYGIILYYIVTKGYFNMFVIVYLIPLYIFNFMASIFFYLQHQYEDTSWKQEEEWDLYTASIHGSSHLVVGKFLAWVSGNVGCHHIHHLNTKIPSFQLHTATEDANQYLDINPIYLKELFRHLKCALWDENTEKLVPIKSIKNKTDKTVDT